MGKYNEWVSYKVCHDLDYGYALYEWNKEGMMWQQCTKWYHKKANLKRHVLKHFGLHIM